VAAEAGREGGPVRQQTGLAHLGLTRLQYVKTNEPIYGLIVSSGAS